MDTARLSDASACFVAHAAIVTSELASAPTPCGDWDIHALVAHVVGGNRFAVLVLGGMSASDAFEQVLSTRLLGDDLGHDARVSGDEVVAAFAARGGSGIVDHLMGPMEVRRFAAMRTFDVTVHAWDLARACGSDPDLPEPLVDAVLADVAADPGALEAFGIEALDTPDAATPLERLLAVTGRPTGWSPPSSPREAP